MLMIVSLVSLSTPLLHRKVFDKQLIPLVPRAEAVGCSVNSWELCFSK